MRSLWSRGSLRSPSIAGRTLDGHAEDDVPKLLAVAQSAAVEDLNPSESTCHQQPQALSAPLSTPPPPPSPPPLQSPTLPVQAPTYLRVTPTRLRFDSSSTADTYTPATEISPVEELNESVCQADLGDATLPAALLPLPASPPLDSDALSKPSSSEGPPRLERRQSLLAPQQTKLIETLLKTDIPPPSLTGTLDYFTSNGPSTISANMVTRKIWVRRPAASATMVSIHEDDLVDDVRDMILKKYANSLGRSFDAPDVTLHICPRENRQERQLAPDEPIGRTIDAYYPGGQTVDEALIIDVPVRRTPKPSPRGILQSNNAYYQEDLRPGETGTDYFPPMPAIPSPHLPPNRGSMPVSSQLSHHHQAPLHAMSVLATGHVPNLPSPGAASTRRHHTRPRVGRTHTSSPTIINGLAQTPAVASNGTHLHPPASRSRTHSSASELSAAAPAPPPLPTPPTQEVQRVATPPPQVAPPRVASTNRRKTKKTSDHPSLPAGMLNGAVPPINVLIVEDNIINLKLLEAFMKRLKVRWQTAMNGREAVTKWRAGGFHLVLMDIQLPVMNGLEATREIRRLEKLNSIGVFSSSASSSAPERAAADEPEGDDKLPSTILFKSPVIIVALTASSLQSDRHEALAAGCNDFLTKVSAFAFQASISPPLVLLQYRHTRCLCSC